jgi:hypothetical protein
LDFDVAKARSDHKYLQTYAKKAEAAYARRDYKGGTAFERWAKSVVAAGEGLIQAPRNSKEQGFFRGIIQTSSSRGALTIKCGTSNEFDCRANTVTVKNTGCGSLAHEILHAADFARTTTSVTCGIRTIDNPTVSSGCARKRGPHQWDLAVIRIIPGEKGVIGRPASLLCVIGTLTTLTLAGPFRGRFELPHGIDVRPATRRARVVAQSPSSSSQHEKRRDNGNGGAVMTYGTAGAPRRARRWCVWAPVILAVGALLGGGRPLASSVSAIQAWHQVWSRPLQ